MRLAALALATIVICTSVPFAQPSGPLQLETKIPLGNVAGRIDHMAIDLERHRLFVAELGNDSVGIVDLNTRKVVHRISGLKEPQGLAYIRMNDSLYVANGGDGSVRVFRGPDYSQTGRIDLGADADNIRVDLPANRILVGFGSGAIAAIDLRENAKSKTFALKVHPESFQLDAASRQLFVNLPNARTIAVLDANTGKETHTWPLRHGANFSMALDPDRKRVLVAFRNPAKLAAFDWEIGGLASEVDICGDADDLFVDQKLKRVYVTCGAGFIDVLRADDARYARLARVPTVAERERVSSSLKWIACSWVFALASKSRRPSGYIVRLRRPGDGCNHWRRDCRPRRRIGLGHTRVPWIFFIYDHDPSACGCGVGVPSL
jgi:YVTN family beta-propeller protein